MGILGDGVRPATLRSIKGYSTALLRRGTSVGPAAADAASMDDFIPAFTVLELLHRFRMRTVDILKVRSA